MAFAGWCVLGPFSSIRRFIFSVGWLIAALFSHAYLMSLMFPASSPGERGFRLAGLLVVQWLAVQIAFWPLAISCHLRISRGALGVSDNRWGQYSIGELLILTALAAMVLGAGRIAIGVYGLEGIDGGRILAAVLHESWIVVTNSIIALLLINATLIRRHAVLATFAAIALVGVITHLEVPFAERLMGTVDATYLQSVATNILQSAWILGLLLTLRAGGYRMTAT